MIDFGILIKPWLSIKGEEVAISGWRDHGSVFYDFIIYIYKPRFKDFEIKVKEDEFFILFEVIRYYKLKLLFIPSLTNPAYVFE